MLEKGFVKFYRTIPQREWFGDDETLKVYVFLLCSIAVEDFETAGRTFRKGQFVTSVKKLSEQCRLSVRQTRTALEHLKATNDITICTTSKYSIITVNLPHETADSGTSAGTLADKHIDNRKRSKGERNKEESNKGEVGAASPPSPSPSDNDDISFCPKSAADERQALVGAYGEDAVALYERKFRKWADKKHAVNVSMYPTIADWLAQDNAAVRRADDNSSLDIDEFERAVMRRYTK